MSRHVYAVGLMVASISVSAMLACGSATSPQNLTGQYEGTYTVDSVTAQALVQQFPPNGTLDSADGETGVLKLTADSFYIALAGNFPARDSGTFTINGSSEWTLAGSLFSGTGAGALFGNQLQLSLSGGTLGRVYGLFVPQ